VTPTPRRTPFVIVGAGIAGLAAAYELARQRVPFLLVERTARLGGVILTERIGGFVIDAGPDALLVQKPAAIALCEELGLGDRLVPTLPPRTAFVLRDGRLHPLPEASILGLPTRLGPLAATRLFSWRAKLRMAIEPFVPPARRGDSEALDESIAQFIGRRFGREVVDYLAEPLMAGIHAGDVDQLSMRSAFPRLVELERTHGSVLRAFRTLPRRADGQGVFRSLPGGLGELVDALARALPPESVRLGDAVVAIEPGADAAHAAVDIEPRGYRVRLASGEVISAGSLILAVPAYVAADLLAPLDAEAAALCRSVPYVSTATVVLGYRRDAVRHPLVGSGFIVPRVESGWRIMAGSWVSSKWPGRAPEGHVLLRAFLGGARDPSVADAEDDELRRMAEEDLGRLLGIEGAPVLVRVYRWLRANAQHTVGHLARVAALEARLRRWPRLWVTGSGFRGTGIPDCVEDGRAVARQAAAEASR